MRGLFAWSLSVTLALGAASCALTLDYSPPDPDGSGMDAGRGDAGTVECVSDAECDDGIACTTDGCAFGTCAHGSTCRGGTECIERDGGICRRACTDSNECSDGIACTDDRCEADGHCGHVSNCPIAARPICLASGACAPDGCTQDSECDDGDPCNGREQCRDGGQCRGGVAMDCTDMTEGCVVGVCDRAAGGCIARAGACGSPEDCMVSTCDLETHHCGPAQPDVTRCDDGDLCTADRCAPDLPGPTHCENGTPMACSAACGAATCNPAFGSCDYSGLCPGGVCTRTGCAGSSGCGPSSPCPTAPDACFVPCLGGTCTPFSCPVHVGECGVLDTLGSGCPVLDTTGGMVRCRHHPDASLCSPVANASASCNPSTFACEYTCASNPGSCVTTVYDSSAGACVTTSNASVCVAMFGAIPSGDCSAWVCDGMGPSGCTRRLEDRNCDDSAACTANERCVPSGPGGGGTCTREVDVGLCDDDAECTDDSCEPARTTDPSGCLHRPIDARCALPTTPDCARTFCGGGGVPPLPRGMSLMSGCAVLYTPCLPTMGGPAPVCDLATGLCTRGATCGPGTACDDGDSCNGLERCGPLGTCIQTLPTSCGPRGPCGPFCSDGRCVSPAISSCVAPLP